MLTQAETIVARLRRGPATTMTLIQVSGSVCPHKRIREAERNGALLPNERIERRPIKTLDGKTVTEFSLVRG